MVAGVIVATSMAAASPTSCSVVYVSKLDASLGIDAAHVTSTHPKGNANALICSYYGDSGRAANEATLNYLPTTAKSFAALETTASASHKVRRIVGIKSAAYSYVVGTERYLYVLDGSSQVQIFAALPLARLEVRPCTAASLITRVIFSRTPTRQGSCSLASNASESCPESLHTDVTKQANARNRRVASCRMRR
jgi:hypothetical protein